jgi:hypothetical protein
MNIIKFKVKVEKIRNLIKDQIREQARSFKLSKKSLIYLTTINMVDWYCNSFFIDGDYTVQSFRVLTQDLRKIAASLPVLVLEDYYAT